MFTRVIACIALLALSAIPAVSQPARSDRETIRQYIDSGRYYEAGKLAERLLAENPNDPEAAALRQEARAGLQKISEDKVRAAEQEANQPGATPEARRRLADAYFEAGRYVTAAESYAALPAAMRDREVRLRHARALAWSGNTDAAERIYTELLAESSDPELELEYGRALSWMGASRAAIERLSRVYETQKTEDAVVALANARAWSGDREGAIALLDAHIAANPTHAEASTLLIEMRSSPNLQIERVERMIEAEPYNLALHFEKARLLADAERWGEARRTIRFIDEHSSREVEGLDELKARIDTARRNSLGDLSERKRQLDQREPSTAGEIAELARAYVALEEYDEAIALYDSYLRIRPDDTKARIEYARVLGWDRRYTAAKRQYRQLLRETPDRADLQLEYAQILSYDDDYANAVRAFEDLTDLSDNPRAHLYEEVPTRALFNLGQIYRWFGWTEHAVDAQREAIELDAGYGPARRELDLVRHLRPATRLEGRYTHSENSSGFEFDGFDLQGEKWTSQRTAITGWLGRHRFARLGNEANATVVGVGGRYRWQDRLTGWGRVGANLYDEDLGTRPFWNLGAEYLPSLQSRASLEYAHYDLVYDVFTVESLEGTVTNPSDPIDIDDLRAHWDYRTGGFWSYLADASYGRISDDNTRLAAHGLVTFRILKEPFVAVKADYRHLEYDFRSRRYWSPTDYDSLAGVLHVGHNFRERVFVQAELKYGKSWENSQERDIRSIESSVVVPINDAFDVIGAYGEGRSGRFDSALPGEDDFITYWQRRFYVGVRVKRLFRRDDREGRNPYYFEERPYGSSPVIPPLGERR